MYRLTNVVFDLQVNGLSNRYWGWGREDDEFYVRMVEAEFTVSNNFSITPKWS